jgi:replicative superfamily II helicase
MSLDTSVRISTGDQRDPIKPEEAELVVTTYEADPLRWR